MTTHILQDPKWLEMAEAGTLSKLKKAELAEYLVAAKLPKTASDNSILAKRIKMHATVSAHGLHVLINKEKKTPFQLKASELRKEVAKRKGNPMGNNDELWQILIDFLLEEKATDKNISSSSSTDGGEGRPSKAILAAKQILALEDDYAGILSIGTSDGAATIDKNSPTALMRKAYMKLSLMIHPDKLQKFYPEATKAFQSLVTAYERLSQPELFPGDDDDGGKEKPRTVMRSNDGCYRTCLYCPRCSEQWGLSNSGVDKFEYNFMMMGLKTYNCVTCLLNFGCMTAIHKCPFCSTYFEYHPNDYHRFIKCGKAACNKKFGFWMYHVSARREKELRCELLKYQESLMKQKDSKNRRRKRALSRHSNVEKNSQEKLFVLNLLDYCPRCGDSDVDADSESRVQHLTICTDTEKIQAFKKRVEADKNRALQKEEDAEKQDEVANLKTWEYLGAESTNMWLLSEKQLQGLCKSYELNEIGTREELIARVAKHRSKLDSSRLLMGKDGQSSSKRAKVTIESLPSNLHSLSFDQLKGVCAAHGIRPRGRSKKGVIDQLEKELQKNEPDVLLLES